MEEVVLLDEHGIERGTAEKHRAHREGLLHRAFSIFLVNDEGCLLLQRRSTAKYHSPGLWANSCCGHPRPGEVMDLAAHRRLREELGISVDLTFAFQTRYRDPVGNGMMENELVDVYFGRFNGSFQLNRTEVDSVSWIDPSKLADSIAMNPEAYAVWLRHYMAQHRSLIEEQIESSPS